MAIKVDPRCRYTKTHEWIRVTGEHGYVGITDYAQEALGDIVYVELPSVGDHFSQGEPFGNVESVKAVSDCYAPLSGKVTEVNDVLADNPETINEDPYGEGWLVKIELSDESQLEELMDHAKYKKYVAEEAGA